MFFASASAGQNEQLFWSVPPRWLFWKTSIVSRFMTLDKRDGTTVRFFFHLDNQNSLYRWLYWNMRWTNEVLFLKVFGGGLPYTCHYNSRVFILDFNWNCCRLQEAKKFSRNPGQFKCVTRKTRYHVSIAELLIRNL